MCIRDRVRKKCKNTLVVAATILSKAGLVSLVRLIQSMCKPFFDEHAQAAADARSPQDTVTYYCQAAKGQWTSILA
eukprot:10425650-Lingulodinium_polyedra.AAC.1